VESLAELREAVAFYGATAAAKLRRDGQVAKAMAVFITTSRFRPREPYYANSQTLILPYPANDTPTLVRAALEATEQLYQPGYSFHKAGVMLMNLSPEEIVQESIFGGQTGQERNWELMEVFDSLNRQFGSGTIRWAAEGLRQGWRMRADRLTQRYTTRWDELVSAN
jgi:DNA polymerase V